MLCKSFIQNPKGVKYSGEDNDENILYIFRQSFLINIPWIVGSFLLLFVPFIVIPFVPSFINLSFIFSTTLFWYVFIFGYVFQQFMNWFFNVYIITDKKIIDVDFQGISYKKISEASLKSVEDVTSSIDGPFGITFNIGNVYIQTAAENREFEFDNDDSATDTELTNVENILRKMIE